MTFKQAVLSGFRNYADFSARAPRSEYWYWMLFLCIVSVVAGAVDGLLFGSSERGPANTLTFLGLTIPGLAVGARRLHDIGRTGWWQLLTLTLVGVILLVIWSLMRGTDGPNRFGPDPLATHSGDDALTESHSTSTGVART